MNNPLSRAIFECINTGVRQQLTPQEMESFTRQVQRELAPKIESIRCEQKIGYDKCKRLMVD